MSEGSFTDEELVRIYRREGSGAACEAHVEELFRRHYPRVRQWCERMTGDREAAPDLAQEVFLKAFRHLPSFTGNSKFSTWLFAIARNHCLSAVRARYARPDASAEPLLPALVDAQPGPDGLLQRAEVSRLLRDLIQTSLDERERQIVALHYVDELPLDAITRALNLPNASGAKAYVVSARRKLARALARRSRPAAC